jgi:hypothetical protein
MTPKTLDKLSCCRTSLETARDFALETVPDLYGARAARAGDLAEQIADTIAYVERLRFVVAADIRYERG